MTRTRKKVNKKCIKYKKNIKKKRSTSIVQIWSGPEIIATSQEDLSPDFKKAKSSQRLPKATRQDTWHVLFSLKSITKVYGALGMRIMTWEQLIGCYLLGCDSIVPLVLGQRRGWRHIYSLINKLGEKKRAQTSRIMKIIGKES